ncbi:hypothetical protein RRG08_012112 [Elysia crispata]|uniref:Uncharacterized protein n=1 Tax=Elysia crispata TaxID=231223 RepID=A0AAE1E4M0_9GAST|nr:hypothetical protein RRG08_012112 [Elysia crispata]
MESYYWVQSAAKNPRIRYRTSETQWIRALRVEDPSGDVDHVNVLISPCTCSYEAGSPREDGPASRP